MRDINISFAQLGKEGCETCGQFHQNKNSHGHQVNMGELRERLGSDPKDEHEHEADECEECERWIKYINAAIKSRDHYQVSAKWNAAEDKVVLSADLQKGLYVATYCMSGNTTAMSTHRIVAFHETCGSVGDTSKNMNIEKDNICGLAWRDKWQKARWQ